LHLSEASGSLKCWGLFKIIIINIKLELFKLILIEFDKIQAISFHFVELVKPRIVEIIFLPDVGVTADCFSPSGDTSKMP
jgi:hypothetical protein